MDSTTEFFRKATKEFKAADALLSSQLKLHHDQAAANQALAIKKSKAAEESAAGYIQAVEKMDEVSEIYPNITITPQVDGDLSALKNLSASVKAQKDELDRIERQVATLQQELKSTLAWERFARKKKYIIRAGLTALAIGLAVALHFQFLKTTKLSFALSLDGKDFPAEISPNIAVDDKPFTSGGKINLGRHKIAVTFPGGEPFAKTAWTFYGNNNLGALPLETSKGSLSVTVMPSPATVFVKQNDKVISQGDAPFKAGKLPVGDYTVLIRRGDYEESKPVKIERQQETVASIELNLGGVELFSDAPDASYLLSGNGWHSLGKLPVKIDDVPGGNYLLTVSRNGWEQKTDILVNRGGITTNKTEFQYGSIELTSIPTGLVISTNGVEIGKTPITLSELKPAQYTITASDGANDLAADVSVAPKEVAKHNFEFHYGTIQLVSTPAGASVIRNRKEIGKTPLTLNHALAGDAVVELQMPGYVSTNLAIEVIEGLATNFSAKLISQRYVKAMEQAREAFDGTHYIDSKNFLAVALQEEPNDPAATELQNQVFKALAKAEEARQEAERQAEIIRKAEEKTEVVAIIEKAITAVGGRDVINRFRSVKSVSHTTGKSGGSDFSMASTFYTQLPDSIRLDQDTDNAPKKLGPLTLTINGGKPSHSAFCLTGNGSWEVVPGILGTVQMSLGKIVQSELTTSLYLMECMTLIPLLETDYTLEKAPDSSITVPNSVAIKASKAGKPVVTMFFDKDSGFLIGLESDKVDNHGNLVHFAERYSRYQNFSGIMYPAVSQYRQDDNTFSTTLTESFEPLVQYYGNVFSEPPRQQ